MNQTHFHPLSGKPIIGELLTEDSVLQPTDVYSSSDGNWNFFIHAGCKVSDVVISSAFMDESEIVWVRPTISRI